ncbi:MAG: TetR/AcrR family transcriptional regulator [Acidobacteriota bacterium]
MTITDTRERLIETAARLFHEQGYAATGVSTILREAGVHSGSLYYFFSSKEALLGAVLDRYVERLKPDMLSRAEAVTADPVERVFALLGVYRMGLEMTSCTLGCPIGNLALELGDAYPDLRRKVETNFENWSAAVAGWLRQGAGRFPADTDLDALADFVLIVMEGGIMQARARKSLAPFDAAVASLRDYFERLYETGSRPSRMIKPATKRRK